MSKVLCIVTNGFEEIEFLGTIAILRRGRVNVDIFSMHGTQATGKYNIKVSDLNDIKNLNYQNYDLLLIPGGPEYKEMESTPWFIEIIKYFYNNNKYIAAICAGPTILGHLGLLKGLNYTCFKSMNEDFNGTYHDVYAIKDKNIITGISAAGTIDFAFLILETLKGKEEAQKVKNSIYYR